MHTYDLTTNVGKVRLLIHDVSEPWLLSDEEIEAFLSICSNDLNEAAAKACRAIAASLTQSATSVRIGHFSRDNRSPVDFYLRLAERYEKAASESPACDYAEVAWDEIAAREILANEEMRNG